MLPMKVSRIPAHGTCRESSAFYNCSVARPPAAVGHSHGWPLPHEPARHPKAKCGISLPRSMNAFPSPPSLVLCMAMAVPPAFAGDLIAYYRFDTNGSDCLGRSPPFLLTNGPWRAGVSPAFVITNAPFTNGVLHVNGLYEPNGHFVHYLGTAPIQDLRYDSLTVCLDFYPLPQKRSRYSLSKLENRINSWTRDRYLRWLGIDSSLALFRQDNILTGGYFHRWIGFNRESGVLNVTL